MSKAAPSAVDSKRESARMSSSFSGIWIVECGF
jgi:hypothetical protein